MGQSLDVELVESLKLSPFYCIDHDEDDDDLIRLAKKMTITEFAREHVLWKEGEQQVNFHFIVDGLVSLQFKINGSNLFVIKKPGDCFGYDALIHPKQKGRPATYSATVKSDQGARLYTITPKDLQRFWKSNSVSLRSWQQESILPIDEYLRKLNVFRKVDLKQAHVLSTMFTWSKLKANEVLFEEGTPGNAFYVVVKGCVAVEVDVKRHENDQAGADSPSSPLQNEEKLLSHDIHDIGIGGIGVKIADPDKDKNEKEEKTVDAVERRTVYEFKAGNYFGEVSLVINMPRTATIRAKENTTLLVLSKQAFEKYAPYDEDIREELEQLAHKRIAQTLRRYKIPLLSAIPLDKFGLLSKLSKISYYAGGDSILRPKDSESALYIIAYGKVGVYVSKRRSIKATAGDAESKDNKELSQISEIEVSVLSAGHYFGETSLMDDVEHDSEQESDLTGMTEAEKAEYLNKQKGRKARKTTADKGDADSKDKWAELKFRCKTNCVVFSIDKQSFEEFFNKVPQAKSWFNIMLSKYNVHIDTILTNSKATRYFTSFLQSEYAEENINFYTAVSDFKKAFDKSDAKQVQQMAALIGEQYIATTAKQQVNIPSKLRKELMGKIQNKEVTQDMFNQSQHSIYNLLKKDSFPRFKQSRYFQNFLTSVEEWNLNNGAEERRLS